MSRWQPGAHDRLQSAAVELFVQHGFDNVTATQIAERAGLARRTFFRYFSDKREVLFAGSEELPRLAAQALRTADPALSAFDALLGVIEAIGSSIPARGQYARARQSVIAASPELQERERTKLTALSAALAASLEERNVAPESAALLSDLAVILFASAYQRLIQRTDGGEFGSHLRQVVVELRSAIGAGVHPVDPRGDDVH